MKYIYFLILFLCGVAQAQQSNIIFHNVGEDKGMGANICMSVLRDSRGMVWVGTINGLSRYDGYHVTNFRSGKDSNTFISDKIFDLCEDKKGNIWGATTSGIFCYKVKENKFINYIPPTYDFARLVNNILSDKNDDIWATTEWNVVKLNKKTQRFEEIEPFTTNKDSLYNYSVRQNCMLEDPAGKGIWFGSRTGLHFYDHTKKTILSYKNQPNSEIFTNHHIGAVSAAPEGYFWYFDNRTGEAIAFDPVAWKVVKRLDYSGILQGQYIHTLKEDSQHQLWISGWGTFMAMMDYRKGTYQVFQHNINNPLSIAGSHFWDVWEDEDNTIWLATTGGLSICNYQKNAYSIVPIIDKVPQFEGGQLGAFTIDPTDQSWWIASEGAAVSIIHYFPSTGTYKHFDFNKARKNKAGDLPSPVFRIEFINSKPFACTHTGVWEINKFTGEMIPFEKKFENWPFMFYQYVQQRGEDIWFVTSEGHVKWNPQTNRATLIKAPVDSMKDGQKYLYNTIYFDQEGIGWYIPAFGWLAKIDQQQHVSYFNYIKNKPKELSGYITSITGDNEGNLWMAAIGVGLYQYNTRTSEMTLYDNSIGIASFINNAILDKSNRVWIAAGNKFSVMDRASKSISHYNLPIYTNLLGYTNVQQLDSSGTLYSTHYRDIIKFLPDRIQSKPIPATPLISKIIVSGKERLITNEKALNLEPNENSLEFQFGSLINNQFFPYEFEYQLEGFDKTWKVTDQVTSAQYSNLKPGNYTFRVRIKGKDQSWQTAQRFIELHIRMPFYQATWFWTLIAVLFLLALILFYRYRLDRQRLILSLETKAQQLEKEKTMVMYDSLKQQLNPHFLFNSLTSLSGLIQTNQDVAGNFLEQMSGIYRYILKNGDNETVLLKSELEFVKLYIDLQKTRFKNGLIVNVNVPEEYLYYKIAPVTLQNLIENAIKHNIIDVESPLVIDIFIELDYLVVKNNLQKKNMVETSNKKGLAQFETLYRYLSVKPTVIEEKDNSFIVKIPLI